MSQSLRGSTFSKHGLDSHISEMSCFARKPMISGVFGACTTKCRNVQTWDSMTKHPPSITVFGILNLFVEHLAQPSFVST